MKAKPRAGFTVFQNGRTMRLDFIDLDTAWNAYSIIPKRLKPTLPTEERFVVFETPAQALESVEMFFNLDSQ